MFTIIFFYLPADFRVCVRALTDKRLVWSYSCFITPHRVPCVYAINRENLKIEMLTQYNTMYQHHIFNNNTYFMYIQYIIHNSI